MVKKTIKRKNAKATKPMVLPKQLSKTPRPGRDAEASTRLKRHVTMLIDPCNAELGPTAYRGQDGIVSRFRNTQSIGPVVGKSGFIYVFYPAYNAVYAANVNPTDGLPIFTPTSGGPGQTFLLSTAESQRVVAACTACTYTGTELDRSGVLYSGVVPISVFDNVGTTYAGLAAMLQHESRVGDSTYELKWTPDAAEETYWKNGTTTPGDNGARTCMVYIGLGLSSTTTATNFQMVNTLVAEWLPSPGLGLSAPNSNSYDVPGGLEKVRSIASKLGSWWYGAAKTAYNIATSPEARTIATAVMAMM